jgi:hypothetical protein
MSVQGLGKGRTPAPQCGKYLLLLLPGYLQWLETRRVAGYCRGAHRPKQRRQQCLTLKRCSSTAQFLPADESPPAYLLAGGHPPPPPTQPPPQSADEPMRQFGHTNPAHTQFGSRPRALNCRRGDPTTRLYRGCHVYLHTSDPAVNFDL